MRRDAPPRRARGSASRRARRSRRRSARACASSMFIAGASDEAGDEEVERTVVELLRAVDLLQLPLAHDRDAVAHRERLDLVVRDVDRRHAEVVLQLGDLGARLDAQLRVEVRERLVHEEGLRVAHDRAAHGDALTLAAGERTRLAVEQRLEVEDARRVLDARVDLGLRHLLDAQAEGDVLVDVEVRIERVALEHHGDVAVARRHVVHHAVADHDAALADVLESGQHAQRRRLAAARRTDEHHELAVLDVEVHAVDGTRAIRVDLRNAVERHSGHRTPRFKTRISPGADILLPGFPRVETRVWASGARRTLRGWRQHYSTTTPPVVRGRRAHDVRRPGGPRASASSASGPQLDGGLLSGQARGRRPRRGVGDDRARRPRGARRGAALPAARGAPLARGADAPRSRRIPIAGTARSRRMRSGAGSSASSRGSIASRRGSASSSARSRPGRAISRASCPRAPRCSGCRR